VDKSKILSTDRSNKKEGLTMAPHVCITAQPDQMKVRILTFGCQFGKV
jgi:hypothetical protein